MNDVICLTFDVEPTKSRTRQQPLERNVDEYGNSETVAERLRALQRDVAAWESAYLKFREYIDKKQVAERDGCGSYDYSCIAMSGNPEDLDPFEHSQLLEEFGKIRRNVESVEWAVAFWSHRSAELNESYERFVCLSLPPPSPPIEIVRELNSFRSFPT